MKPHSLLVPQAAFCSISFKIKCYIILGTLVSTAVMMISLWTSIIVAREGNLVGCEVVLLISPGFCLFVSTRR